MQEEWKILFFKAFRKRLEQLKDDVKTISIKDPQNYKHHKKTKFLAAVYYLIFTDIKSNPHDPKFLLGNYLGKEYRMWKRAKNSLPARHRLFFRFNTTEKAIVIAWLNDEFTLRKEGASTDVYFIFRKMLVSKQIPTEWFSLKKQSPPKQKTK